jgi:Winged helix-turn-helix DNA-binding
MDGLDLAFPSGLSAERARCIGDPGAAAEAERQILETLRDHPGLTSRELMRLVNAKRGSTLDRLQRLRVRGAIERDGRGWRLRDERPIAEASEETPGAETPERTRPAFDPSRWVQHVNWFLRRETSWFDCRRFG